LNALGEAMQALADVVIYFALFILPTLLVLIFPVLILYWLVRRVFRRRPVRTSGAT
jgi:4-amino-4-deoxy-L-arabinose transferase-like glycosyltransferase